MRSQHQRNSSLLPDKRKSNQFSHHRSFSYNKHHRHPTNLQSNFISPEFNPTDSLTLPLSTEFNQYYRKLPEKAKSKQIVPDKKYGKPRQKESNPKSHRQSKPQSKQKMSNEKSNKGGLKQFAKYKNFCEKGRSPNSAEKKHSHSKSNEYKKSQPDKLHKTREANSKQKVTKKKPSKGSVSLTWQQVLQKYGHYLSIQEISEIKQYKWIYFLGKIPQRKFKILKAPQEQVINTARDRTSGENEVKLFQTISENRELTENNLRIESEDEFYKYEVGDHIAYRYEIVDSISQGAFGEVIKVFDHKTKELLALKIAKRSQQLVQQTFLQITILTQIRQKDKSNLSGVVRIKDFTVFRNHICIVFQLLDGNLYELLVANHYNGLSEDVVRIFAVQILNSLNFLQKQKVIHCDIKPENIVMKTWGKSGIKLVDFGTSCYEGNQIYQYLQSRYYRAPEIIFKKRYSYPIDIWSFGCLIAELKIGEPIFAGSSNTEQLLYIANSIGLPSEADGPYSADFLKSPQFSEIISENYIGTYKAMLAKGEDISNHIFFSQCKYIKTCMKTLRQRLLESKGFNQDDLSFYHFLTKILVWQPDKRLTPQEALHDPWISKGLPNQIRELYTIFNSMEHQKKSKPKRSKDSKVQSKPKSTQKKSKEKGKSKQHSNQRKRQNGYFQLKSKEMVNGSKIYHLSNKGTNYEVTNN